MDANELINNPALEIGAADGASPVNISNEIEGGNPALSDCVTISELNQEDLEKANETVDVNSTDSNDGNCIGEQNVINSNVVGGDFNNNFGTDSSRAVDEDDLSDCNVIAEVDHTALFSHNSDLTCEERSRIVVNILQDFSSSIPKEKSSTDKQVSSELRASSPSSVCSNPQEDLCDSTSARLENQSFTHPSRKNFTLPYFQLPKPDLDEFLVETDNNMKIPEIESKPMNEFSQPSFKSTGAHDDIVFEIDLSTVNKEKTAPHHPLTPEIAHLNEDSDSNKNPKKKSKCDEYANVLTSLKNMDASKAPGLKRLALKEYLKKKIDQKKSDAFNRSKVISKIDQEENIDSEKESSSESESEDNDGKIKMDNFDSRRESSDPSEDENNLISDDLETDEDDLICVKKRKRVTVLEDDSSGESNFSVSSDRVSKWNSNAPNVIQDEESYSIADKEYPVLDPDLLKAKKDKESERLDPDFFWKFKNGEWLGYRKAKLHRKTCSGTDSCCSCDVDFSDLSSTNTFFEEVEFEVTKPSKSKDDLSDRSHFCFSQASNAGLSQICSSIPSYQPCGGFINKESQDSCSSNIESGSEFMDAGNVKSNQPSPLKYLFDGATREDLRTLSEREKSYCDSLNGTLNLGLPFDDLPVSQSENVCELFSSQELADVCSGPFKNAESDNKGTVSSPQDFSHSDSDVSQEDEIPKEKVNDFFDDEAELSGEEEDDYSADDEDEEEGGYDKGFVSDHELPAEELRDEIADLHMKRLRDDDEEMLKVIQEQFLDDGELNNDGQGRERRFAWEKNDKESENMGSNKESSSESDAEAALDDTWSALNKEKAKWREDNEKVDVSEEVNSSSRKSSLKIKIVGKPEFANKGESSKHGSRKRPRGSFLHLDEGSTNQVLKKLKTSEEGSGGSRTTKHFVFLNDEEPTPTVKETPSNVAGEDPVSAEGSKGSPPLDHRSIFTKMLE